MLLAFEDDCDDVGCERGPAEGTPPRAVAESDGTQDREGEEHREVDALVDGDAQNGPGNVLAGFDVAEAKPGDGCQIEEEDEDPDDPCIEFHFLRFLRCKVWKSFSALILSMIVVTTSYIWPPMR